MASEPFFNDTGPYNPPTNCFPTWNTVMRMYLSRVYVPSMGRNKHEMDSPDATISQVSTIVHDIWVSGDGCPKTHKAIQNQFKSEVLPIYKKYRKGDFPSPDETVQKKNKKKKKASSPPPSSTRQSSRVSISAGEGCSSSAASPSPSATESSPCPQPTICTSSSGRPATRGETGPSRYSIWLKDHGHKLFDVFSRTTLDKVLEEGGAFDSVFYTDQRDSSQRELVIETMRVSKDYYEHWRNIEATKARKFAKKLSAFGIQPATSTMSKGS